MSGKSISGIFLILLLIVLGVAGALYFNVLPFKSQNQTSPKISPTSIATSIVEGEILNIVEQENVITIHTLANEKVYVAPVPETKITDENGRKVDSTYLKRGFKIKATGELNEKSAFFPDTITVTNAPNVIVFSPLSKQVVGTAFQVTGIARVFENVISLRIKNANTGDVYSQDTSNVHSKDSGYYGEFRFTYNLDALTTVLPSGEQLILEVFQASAKDGSDRDLISIPLVFQKNLKNEIITVQLFFSNSKLDNIASCENVYPVERQIPKVKSVGQAALEELIKGPQSSELSKGYISNISKSTRINKLIIEDGVAKVDFSSDIEKNVGGSCAVKAIRAQISETLLQFPTVSSVEISVDGKVEEALQP